MFAKLIKQLAFTLHVPRIISKLNCPSTPTPPLFPRLLIQPPFQQHIVREAIRICIIIYYTKRGPRGDGNWLTVGFCSDHCSTIWTQQSFIVNPYHMVVVEIRMNITHHQTCTTWPNNSIKEGIFHHMSNSHPRSIRPWWTSMKLKCSSKHM